MYQNDVKKKKNKFGITFYIFEVFDLTHYWGFLALCTDTDKNVCFLSINYPFPVWFDISAGVCCKQGAQHPFTVQNIQRAMSL